MNDEYLGRQCIAFYKHDGSNIRAEWSPKKGWYKFGTRTRLLGVSDPEYGQAVTIFQQEFGEKIAKAIVDTYKKPEGAMAFLEFFGPHSFAGKHDPGYLQVESNDPKQLVLFDVNIHKKGFVGPDNFRKVFNQVRIAETIYEGVLDEKFVKDVRERNYPLIEGVVCKWGDGFDHTLGSCKIKTWQYLEDLKKRMGQDWQRYWE